MQAKRTGAARRGALDGQSLSRRRLLALAGAGAGAVWASACGGGASQPAPAANPPAAASPVAASSPAAAASPPASLFVKPVPADRFIDFSSNQEMRWEVMGKEGLTTPNAAFFIRDHSRTPVIEQKDWKLKIEGTGIDKPVELTYADLTALPAVSVTRLLECTGNGRSFFETIGGQKAQGTQWRLGAVGVAEWKGAKLADVLAKAGLKPTAKDVLAEGLDELKVRRPIPVDKAKEPDVILAYTMNGEPLPPDHGGPVRLLVSNWIGISSIKWVGRIEVSDAPIHTPWNTDSYVLVGPTYQPAPPAKGPVITTYPVKSALELPWPAELKAGNQTIKGRSWSGSGNIAKVEYSVDGGKTYQTAKLQDAQSAGSWARWSFDWNATAGEQTIRVRATDDKSNTQPDAVPFNEQGYLYNGVVPHPVKVT